MSKNYTLNQRARALRALTPTRFARAVPCFARAPWSAFGRLARSFAARGGSGVVALPIRLSTLAPSRHLGGHRYLLGASSK